MRQHKTKSSEKMVFPSITYFNLHNLWAYVHIHIKHKKSNQKDYYHSEVKVTYHLIVRQWNGSFKINLTVSKEAAKEKFRKLRRLNFSDCFIMEKVRLFTRSGVIYITCVKKYTSCWQQFFSILRDHIYKLCSVTMKRGANWNIAFPALWVNSIPQVTLCCIHQWKGNLSNRYS